MKLNIKTLLTPLVALCSLSFAPISFGAASITYGPGFVSVPTMGGTMLIALAVLLALIAFRLLKDRNPAGSHMVIAIAAATVLATGAGGIKLISEAQAISIVLEFTASSGGVIEVPGPGPWIITNSTDVPQEIKRIEYAPGCSDEPPLRSAKIDILNGAIPSTTCGVSLTLAPGESGSCGLNVFCEAEET